jgi:hypothetical protein
MSDTSIISSYQNHQVKTMNDNDVNTSCCAQYWFRIISSCLLLVIVITTVLLVDFLIKQTERDRKGQRIKGKFKLKHSVANKVLDMIMKDGRNYNWIKAQKGSIATVFKELFTDITETIFDE